MTLLLSTTAVRIEYPTTLSGDGEESISWAVRDTERAAHLSGPSGAEQVNGGQRSVYDAVLYVDSGCEVARYDRVTDLRTGLVWQVSWVQPRTGLGLDHVKAGLVAVDGVGR